MAQDRDAASQARPGGDESLSDAFWAVARQLRETSQETLAPWDITPAQFRALRVLTRHGAMRLSELSDHLHIAARSATEVIDAPRSPGPGRAAARSGRPAGHPGRADRARHQRPGRDPRGPRNEAERVFDRLSPADRADLARILRKLRD